MLAAQVPTHKRTESNYSRGVTLTTDVKKNNYLLPLAGESWDVNPITQARINLAERWAETPAYDKSKGAVVNYFCEMQTACLREHMRLMGIKGVSGLRRDLIAKCIGWWMNHLDEMTKPVLRRTF